MPSNIPDNLFIFELANNHMGDVSHGIKIIEELARVAKQFPFQFAVKMQYRDLDTFIHPDFAKRDDIKYVKRFSETRLSTEQRRELIKAIKDNGFIAMCTPFDNISVKHIVEDGFDILKVGSCSFTDWPMLEQAVQTELPMILSTGGASLEDIDNVYGFLENRKKTFAFMHCIAEYPTKSENMQMNQIDLLRSRYPKIRIGYSTHEVAGEQLAVAMAVAKGCTLFEKHVGVSTNDYALNDYSSGPADVEKWLRTAQSALAMNGLESSSRIEPTPKERETLHSLRRGVFASRDLAAGELLKTEDVFMAIPTQEDHVTANEWSKYNRYYVQEAVKAGAPILNSKVRKESIRDHVLGIVVRVQELLKDGNIVIPRGTKLEVSHHYGIEKFYEYGAALITVINRDYCKKLIAVLPNQKHPNHLHKKKDETLHVLHGTLRVCLDGETREYTSGEMIVVEPGMNHSFESDDGCVFEEISSTHYTNDSVYSDESINENAQRKTLVTYWNDLSAFDLEKARKQFQVQQTALSGKK